MSESTPNALRLLLLEDDEATQILLRLAAQRSGQYSEIKVANDGEQALAFLNAIISGPGGDLPDFIVSDLRMPLVDGAEFTALVKASPKTKNIPVIIITSSALSEDRERALKAGADGFYVKMPNVIETTEFFRSLPTKHPPRAAKG